MVLDAVSSIGSQLDCIASSISSSKDGSSASDQVLIAVERVENAVSKIDVQPWVDLTPVTNELIKVEEAISKVDVSPKVDLSGIEWTLGQIEESVKCPQMDSMVKVKLQLIENALGDLKGPSAVDFTPMTNELTQLLDGMMGQVEAKVLADLNPFE